MFRTLILGVFCIGLTSHAMAQTSPPEWQGLGGNSQHDAQASAALQGLTHIRWKARVDLNPQLSGGELLIHYASPMITAANTVILPVKTGATGGFRVDARKGTSGAPLWSLSSDYILPPHDWTPSFPAQLTAQNRLYYAGAGGTVYYRDTPDAATGTLGQLAFYRLGTYQAHKAAFNNTVEIDTPITSGAAGDIFFGFTVTGANPANLTSGIARIGADGRGRWISAGAAAKDPAMTEVAMNCAPAVSPDGKTVYLAVSNGNSGYLVGLDSATLQPKYEAALNDPSSGSPAWLTDNSSASPTVGPDGDVYYGVLENPFPDHNDRGWLLHFDATLAISKIPGSFGWDDTASIVPASAVPSYSGPSSYLLMTKYNNYLDIGPTGDGHNRIAIVDPNQTQADPYSTATVMKDVITRLGPTPFPGSPGASYEWCINTAVVDLASDAVIANSEDGHVYRWNLANNTIDQRLLLNAPRPEAYTPTVIGPDGTAYAINNAFLYAIGK